ncbi:hypothetical protein PtB15_4B272 [Puccinia triticina]|nr:hypothetical protein PtB15_4B272 [Puccinia triticina]
MNIRQASLRSNSRTSSSTSKRSVPHDPGQPKVSQPKKKSKKSPHPHTAHVNERDILPSSALLSKLSEVSTYHRALLLKKHQETELRELDQLLSNAPFSKSKNEQSNSKDRLLRVLRWKLLRGQFRATLPALVSQNSTESVDKVIENALELLSACRTVDQALQSGALTTMCELRGIGPATAAAFLSFEAPDLIAVFSDEAASFFENSLGPIKYTLPFYKRFVECMQVTLQEFAGLDNSWDLRRLERALWTFRVLEKYMTTEEWNQLISPTNIQLEPSRTTSDFSPGQSDHP